MSVLEGFHKYCDQLLVYTNTHKLMHRHFSSVRKEFLKLTLLYFCFFPHSIIKPIGEGNFGTVSRGAWLPPDGRHEVAVKMLKMGANEDDRLKLLQEAAIMGQFVHKNVVKLHGVVTVGEPVSGMDSTSTV